MADAQTHNVTELLRRWSAGERRAADDLIPLVYNELRRLAQHFMKGERSDHTLQATGLVHEAYRRLVGTDVPWQDRAHFFNIAARTMRRILVEHARAHQAEKRGGGLRKRTLTEADAVLEAEPEDLLALDTALTRLAAFDERKSRAIELHYFSGMTYDETARVLDISRATLHREMKLARSWLQRELETDPAAGTGHEA